MHKWRHIQSDRV